MNLGLTISQLNLYGLTIAFAILMGTLLCIREEKHRNLPKDLGIDIILFAVPLAVIFSRIYYVIFAWNQFRFEPIRALYIWEGGLAIYGGVIGGVLGLWLLSKRRKIPMLTLTDVAVPSLLLGQAIGRWGNFFNREAHGQLVSNASLRFFPVAVQINDSWFYATFFYESMWNLLGFVFLYANRRKMRETHPRGDLTLWYFAWYGLGRMTIEMLRTDSLMLGSMRVSQGLSILLFAVAMVLLSRRRKIGHKVYFLLAIGLLTTIYAATQENLALLLAGVIMNAVYAAIVYASYRRTKYHAPTNL